MRLIENGARSQLKPTPTELSGSRLVKQGFEPPVGRQRSEIIPPMAMSITPLPTPSNLEELPRHPMPTMYDLPSENPEDPGLPDDFHSLQAILLLLTFQPFNWDPEMV